MDKVFNFTKFALLAIPTPDIKFVTYSDTGEKGLKLYVTKNGKKTFFIRKRVNQSDERFIIGDFPTLSVENARKEAQKIKYNLAQGINPNDVKREQKQEMNLGEMIEYYIQQHSKKENKRWEEEERDFKRLIPTRWLKKKITTITKKDLLELHTRIGEQSGKYQSNRLLQRFRSMMNKAIEWGFMTEKNPAIGIKLFKEEKRDRFLLPEELPRFFEALEEVSNPYFKNFIWLSLLTGARKSNVLAMRWSDIDYSLKRWRIPETKNGEPLNLPLTEEALKILEGMPKEKGTDWVFPSPLAKTGHLTETKRAWANLLKQANLSNLRLHDLRRTLASYQAINGSSMLIIGKSLGHKSSEATAIYARLTADPVRESMEKATQFMLQKANQS